MVYHEQISGNGEGLGPHELREGLFEALEMLGNRQRVLIVPPDFTRAHSFAGPLTEYAWEYYGDAVSDVLPALGTHSPMTSRQIAQMFGPVPSGLFRVHDWRRDVVSLGDVPGEYLREVSGDQVSFPWPAQVNRLLADGGHDLILSVGQVVPHEVAGMANYNKNIFVGTGGAEGINKSHFLGAVFGMERIMGRADNPVRKVLNYASEHFGIGMPIVYVLTVVGKNPFGNLAVQGLFVGDDPECFNRAAQLSMQHNFEMLERPIRKVVVYLNPDEYKSTWLGNKSIYRTRMAIEDGGELIVLAPGVREFGEDPEIDRLIRRYGYRSSREILGLTEREIDLQENLSAAAHLIHGSPEGRFTVRYCSGHLSRAEVEGVGFEYGDLAQMLLRYDPNELEDGLNLLPGEEPIYFISNPALGLWAAKERFK